MRESNKVMQLLTNYHYKNTPMGILATVKTANGKEDVPITSDLFYSLVALDYQNRNEGETVSRGAIKDAVFNFKGRIIATVPQQENKLRVSMSEDSSIIRINKGDRDGHYYKITKNGWSEESDGENYFASDPMLASLPDPAPDAQIIDIKRIFKYCRIPADKQTVFLAFLVSCFIDIIHPCLVLQGEAGSSKTTVSKIIKMLTDPSRNNAPCIFPDNPLKLKDIYAHSYVIAYDNLARLSKNQSNVLCSIVTGSQLILRILFTDSEVRTYELKQPIILNGIQSIVNEKDMIDRSIIVELPSIDSSERKSERALMMHYQEDLPYIWGAILQILPKVLKKYKPDSLTDIPRLADFYEYGFYICEAMEKGLGKRFCTEYHNLLKDQEDPISKDDKMFIEFLQCYLDQKITRPKTAFSTTIGSLYTDLKELKEEYEDYDINFALRNSPAWMAKDLRRLSEPLKRVGIYIQFSATSDNCSSITFYCPDLWDRANNKSQF